MVTLGADEQGVLIPTGKERADQERQRADQERQRADQERRTRRTFCGVTPPAGIDPKQT